MQRSSPKTAITRRLALALIAAVATTTSGFAQTANDPDASYDALLARYVVVSPDGVNRVDYARWHKSAEDRKALDAYISTLAARKPSAMPRGEAFAYWGNLYNAITLKVILDRYPVASIRDIKSSGGWFDFKSYTGPWREQRVTVEGRKVSLDDIEHDIMRPTFKDPRVHYVVNCASYGCPNLMNRAWRAATLEADLDRAARSFINHPRGVTVLPSGGLKVSSIYKWFISDFGGDDASLLKHFKTYAAPDLASRLSATAKVQEDAYDWSLNAVTATRAKGE
jgi:Protein of unknown function, DUF547